MSGLFAWICIIALIILIAKSNKPYNEEELNRQLIAQADAATNIICPHCQTKGSVTTVQVKKKVGISGGKATAGILTCGLSILGTGLSRKDNVTEANCLNCGSRWTF